MQTIDLKTQTQCILLTLVFALLTPFSSQAQTPSPFEKQYLQIIHNKGKASESERLRNLFDLSWKHLMIRSPETATYLGLPGQNDRWSDISPSAIEQIKKDCQIQLKVLASIDRAQLTSSDQLSYDLYKLKKVEYLEQVPFHREALQLDQLSGVHQLIPEIFQVMPKTTLKDYQDRISRLKRFPKVVDQTIEHLKKGIKLGITPSQITLRNVPQQIKDQLEPNPEKSPILQSFREMPASFSEKQKNEIKSEATEILKQQILPSLKKFYNYVVNDYIPHCRKTAAWSALPQGKLWYSVLVRHMTHLDLSPQEIHDIGLREVARIRTEMEKIMTSLQFEGTLSEFGEKLRNDPQMTYTRKEDLLAAYKTLSHKVDQKLGMLFSKLPSLSYEIKPVPEYSEASQPTGYYEPGSLQTHRPGVFYANTYNLKTRPKWEMEPLFLHEAVPGHHLQISIAKELSNLPEFRKDLHDVTFGEGWGLYAEGLGEEMGIYEDTYSQFGKLNFEIWRAIRLVVDTGIHYLGWSREKAIQYFKDNSAKASHDIEVEVNRYMVMPAQALAYKMGELKFKELRDYSKNQLGEKFDVRAFHQKVLENGSIPLKLLESLIYEWVKNQKEAHVSQ